MPRLMTRAVAVVSNKPSWRAKCQLSLLTGIQDIVYFQDKCLCRFGYYMFLFYVCDTLECNALSRGMFVTDVTLTLAIDARHSCFVIAVFVFSHHHPHPQGALKRGIV